jgi:hypothetical protein
MPESRVVVAVGSAKMWEKAYVSSGGGGGAWAKIGVVSPARRVTAKATAMTRSIVMSPAPVTVMSAVSLVSMNSGAGVGLPHPPDGVPESDIYISVVLSQAVGNKYNVFRAS